MLNDDLDEIDQEEYIKNDNRDDDPQIFGFSSERGWQLIGNVYYFLVSMSNLVDTVNDESPIIDNNGNIKGRINYSIKYGVEEGGMAQNIMLFDKI